MNPNLLAALEAPAFDTPVAAPETAGYGEIVGRNLGNLIPKAVSSLGGSLEGILNLGAAPEDRTDIPDMPNWVEPPKLTESATGGQQLTNVLTGGVLPELVALFMPYVGASKVAKLGGAGQFGQAMAGNITQGAVAGIKYGPEEALEFGLTGGALSGIGAIPGVFRRAAITSPIAGLEYALHEDEGLAEGATAAATTLLGGILPSVSRARVPAESPSGLRIAADQTVPLQATVDEVILPPSGLRLAEEGITSPAQTLEGFILQNKPVPELIGPPAPGMQLESPTAFFGGKRAANLADIPMIGEQVGPLTKLLRSGPLREAAPRELAWIEAEMPGVILRQDIPSSNVRSSTPLSAIEAPAPTGIPERTLPPPAMEGPLNAITEAPLTRFNKPIWKKMEVVYKPTLERGQVRRDSQGNLWEWKSGNRYAEAVPFRAAESTPPIAPQSVTENMIEATKEAGRRGKLRDLPEYRRTEGGVTIPEIVNTLGQVGVGATLGAIADPYVDEAFGSDINTTGLGAGLPIARQLSKLIPEAFGVSDKSKMFTLPHPAFEKYPKYKDSLTGKTLVRIPNVEADIDWQALFPDGKRTMVSAEKYAGEFLDHPIFEQYPDLRNLKIRVRVSPNNKFAGQGKYFEAKDSPWGEEIIIVNARDDRQARVVLNHELQHAVDTRNKLPYQVGEQAYMQRPGEKRAFTDEDLEYGVPPPEWLTELPPAPKMKLADMAKSGNVSLEALSSLGGGVAGGLTGYAASEGDPFAAGAGALLGAGGGAAIASAFRSPGIKRTAAEIAEEVKSAKTAATSIPTGKTSIQDLTNSLKSAAKDLTEGNTYGQGGPFSRVFDFIDKQFRVTMSPEVKSTITHARGEVARLSERAMAYLKPYLSSGTPQSLVDKANRYLDGIGNSVTDEVNFIRGNGGIDDIAYNQLNPQQKKGYTTWRVSEDTANPRGVGQHQAFKMHVPIQQLDQLKDQWNQKLTSDFLNSVNVDERPAAEAIVKARGNFNEIQRIFERALPAGSTQQLVTESVGRYVPRLFRAFTDPDYKITDADIQGYIGEFGLNKRGETLDLAIRSSEAYDQTVFTNLLNKPKNTPAQIAAQARLQQFVPYTLDGRNVYVLPAVRDRLEALKNDVHLENMIRSHLQELGASERVQRTGAATGGLDKNLFKKREDLTPSYRKLLGEFTDPVERMAMAFSRTFAPAQAASLMDLAKNINLPSGLKSAYEPGEWAQALQRASAAGNNALVQELKQMKLIGKSATFGEYAGNYVNRHLADYFEGGSQLWNQSIGRGIAEFNKLFKTGHVPLNPLSHVRQIMSIPAFLAIGKAAPQDVRQAWNALFAGAREENTLNALTRDELLSVGAWTSDLIKGELQGNIDTFLSGRYDSTLMKSTKGVVNSVLEAYRKPDMLVRAATYLGAKRRALEAGLSSEEAKISAIQWMDRYTMNYDNIAPAVRFMRNVPGVSPFISYQAEMIRLVKNMVADGVNGNPERLGTLGLITAIPVGAVAVAENSLSPEEKKEWQRTKSLMPDYSQGKLLMPTGKNPNGSIKYWDISPDIAHSDLIRLVTNIATGNTSAALEQNPFVGTTSSPILQALAKVTTQRDPRTNQELGSGSEATLSAISDILPPITPGVGYEWTRLANVDVENLYTGRKESWGDWATRLVTGASGSSVRLSTLQDSLKREFSRTAANARAEYLRTARLTGDNPGLQARKTAAYNEYRQTMADALTEFQQKFESIQEPQSVASN